jgi:hypothetical protein
MFTWASAWRNRGSAMQGCRVMHTFSGTSFNRPIRRLFEKSLQDAASLHEVLRVTSASGN